MSNTPTTYWSTSQIRITGEGPDGALIIELDRPFAIIGTHERSDLVLQGRQVARRHLYLHATDEGIYCVNLAQARRDKSLTGTWIRNEQTVRAGPYTLQFGFVSGKTLNADDGCIDLLERKSVERPFPLLLFSANDSRHWNRLLSRRLSFVGRDRFCSFQLASRSISPVHCVIYQQARLIWIVDLKSGRKTLLNGQAIKVAKIVNNSAVKIGRVNISIQRTAEADRVHRWKSENVVSTDGGSDLEGTIDQLLVAESLPTEQLRKSPPATVIPETIPNTDVFPPDNESVCSGSDPDSQLDDNNESLASSPAAANDFTNEDMKQTGQQPLVASITDELQQRHTELETLATELERLGVNLIRQEIARQEQQSQIEQELLQQAKTFDERNRIPEKRNCSLDEREQSLHNRQKDVENQQRNVEAGNRQLDEKSRLMAELSETLTRRERDVKIAEAQQVQQLSVLQYQKSELDKRFSEMQKERERFELQMEESTVRASQLRTGLDHREMDLVTREKELAESRVALRDDREKQSLKYETEKKQLISQIAALQDSLQESEAERLRIVAAFQDQLAVMQQDDREKQMQHERDIAELQQLHSNFEEQRSSWLDEQRQREIQQQAAIERLQLELRQITNQRLEIQETLDTACQKLTESEDRVKGFVDLELQQDQLADDRARLEVERGQFEEQMKLGRDDLERREAEVDKQTRSLREKFEADKESLIAAQKSLEQERADLEQCQKTGLIELEQKNDQLQTASDQLRERETRLANEVRDFETRQTAWLEESSVVSTGGNLDEELQLLSHQLDVERSRFAEQQAQWELNRLQQTEEAAAIAEKLETKKAELVVAREKLDADQREFDRYVTIDITQQKVMANLNKMRREETSAHRIWGWLLGRKE